MQLEFTMFNIHYPHRFKSTAFLLMQASAESDQRRKVKAQADHNKRASVCMFVWPLPRVEARAMRRAPRVFQSPCSPLTFELCVVSTAFASEQQQLTTTREALRRERTNHAAKSHIQECSNGHDKIPATAHQQMRMTCTCPTEKTEKHSRKQGAALLSCPLMSADEVASRFSLSSS